MARNDSLEGIIVYDQGVEKDGQKKFDRYSLHGSNPSAAGYMIGELVEKVERQIVVRADDPVYQVSSKIANRLVKDKTLGSMVALGIYSLLNSIGGDEK